MFAIGEHLHRFKVVQVWATLPLGTARWLTTGLFCVSTFFVARLLAGSPDSTLYRVASQRVAKLNDLCRAMQKEERGEATVVAEALIIACVLVAAAATGYLTILCLLPIAAVPSTRIRSSASARRTLLGKQIPEFAQALSNAMTSTASVGDALRLTTKNSPTPLNEELEITLRQIDIGASLQDALSDMAGRLKSAPLDVVISALTVGYRTGGNVPTILAGVAESLRENRRLEEHTAHVTDGPRKAYRTSSIMCIVMVIIPLVVFPPTRDFVQTMEGKKTLALVLGGLLFAHMIAKRVLGAKVT